MTYICVDFDGTMVEHMFPEIGDPVPGAIEWVKQLQTAGAKIILWTVRSNTAERNTLDEAVSYMNRNGIKLYAVNENPAQQSFSSSPKAWGNIYIDDAAYGCPLCTPRFFNRACVDWRIVGPAVYEQLTGQPNMPVPYAVYAIEYIDCDKNVNIARVTAQTDVDAVQHLISVRCCMICRVERTTIAPEYAQIRIEGFMNDYVFSTDTI